MRKLALAAAIALGLTGLAAPAMASEPVPSDQSYSLTGAPVDPSPSHHKIKPPVYGTGDLWQLIHGGFNDAAATADTSGADYASTAQARSSSVLLAAGVVVAKVAKAKALKQPKQPKQKTAKQAAPKTQKQPPPRKVVGAKQPATTKATTALPPTMTPQQAQQYAFQFPVRVRPKIRH